jgi:hypothetical protein
MTRPSASGLKVYLGAAVSTDLTVTALVERKTRPITAEPERHSRGGDKIRDGLSSRAAVQPARIAVG